MSSNTAYYNCRHDGDQYRITKFDTDLNVESTYLCTTSACECPAGVRPTCRHRQMLPEFLRKPGSVGGNVFLNWDTKEWFANDAYEPIEDDPSVEVASTEIETTTDSPTDPTPPPSPRFDDRRI